jgi:hypothetical protein
MQFQTALPKLCIEKSFVSRRDFSRADKLFVSPAEPASASDTWLR